MCVERVNVGVLRGLMWGVLRGLMWGVLRGLMCVC